MKGSEHRAEMERLHAEGLSYREIGERYGLPLKQVWRICNPEKVRAAETKRAQAKRAWERDPANRIPCVTCGGPTGHTPGQHSKTSRPEGKRQCRACRTADRNARRSERGHRIEQWWAEGLTLAEIAARLGWSVEHLGVEMVYLRRKGFNLPYRRTPKQHQRIHEGRRAA